MHGSVPAYSGGFLPTARSILAHEGVRGLYKGLGVSVLKSGLASAITFLAYAECKWLLSWIAG
jgi:solute carrier family 25 thiamine pyrophosphate transporter 19